ncbi:hypothetical protein F4677DRAFT_456886 [Hypoxylon crocopeplum]|nr:hypothetical protein F4677DRAFT_456886 [Hypoxylon crocopeplum]
MSGSNPFSTLFNQQNPTAKLAILKPAADRNAPIELDLTDAPLKETSYECISYDRSAKTSAADDNTVIISVDGEDQTIPKALASALRTFRRKERPRTLWADLLVGRTVEERSAQASHQRHVLENAERTLCWLGLDKGESTAKAFETIHEMGRRWDEASREVGMDPDANLTRTTMQQIAGLREKLSSCPYNDLNSFDFAHWREIYDIFGSSYWMSVQCVSDVVLAKAPIVVCGRSNIRWHSYIAASRAMPLYQAKFFQVPLLPHVFKGFEIANSIELAERRRRLGETIELLPMIQTARDCGAADPRENVFSMMLISTPSARLKFHKAGPQSLPAIDYAKTTQQVFTEAARYVILERQDLLLWNNERPPCARRVPGMPSWVPDFSAVPPKVPARLNPNSGMRVWWDNISPASAVKPITASEDGNALHIQVRPLDRIVHVSDIFNAGNCRPLCLSEFQGIVSSTTSSFANETFEQKNERFWRTLILNSGGVRDASATLRDNAPPPAEMRVNFESLIAEETILAALGCTPHDLQRPANAARIQASPELTALVPRCGQAQPYEALLAKAAAGRRFFRTAGGRFGMTAIEDVVCADSNLRGEQPREPAGNLRAAAADMSRLMSDPLTAGALQGFQQYLFERDPQTARVAARAFRGQVDGLPGGEGEEPRTDGGVMEGDLVVACVGGFVPYVLRPQKREEAGEDGNSTGSTAEGSEDSSTYEFVGECYLHGAMEAEDFQATGFLGRRYFNVDVSKLVDVTIV